MINTKKKMKNFSWITLRETNVIRNIKFHNNSESLISKIKVKKVWTRS